MKRRTNTYPVLSEGVLENEPNTLTRSSYRTRSCQPYDSPAAWPKCQLLVGRTTDNTIVNADSDTDIRRAYCIVCNEEREVLVFQLAILFWEILPHLTLFLRNERDACIAVGRRYGQAPKLLQRFRCVRQRCRQFLKIILNLGREMARLCDKDLARP